jgi:hypothetical protein
MADYYSVPWPPSLDREAPLFGESLIRLYRTPREHAPDGSDVDVLGWMRWSSDYRIHRANGLSHDAASERITNDILQIWRSQGWVGDGTFEPEPEPVARRTGIVSVDGNVLLDEQGIWPVLGCTLFPAAALVDDYKEIAEANGRYLQSKGVECIRSLAVVGGDIDPDPWANLPVDPRRPDYQEMIIASTDYFYDRFGIRTAWTIFGGVKFAPTHDDQRRVVRTVLSSMRGRLHKVAWFEVANEMWQNGFGGSEGIARARDLARLLADNLPAGFPVAISSAESVPNGWDEHRQNEELREMFAGSAANLGTNHFDRDNTKMDREWRAIRQPWDWRPSDDYPHAAINNEPIGPGSSVVSDRNPSRLCAGYLTSAIAGMAGHIFHPDAGVWAGLLLDHYRQGDNGRHRLIQDEPGADAALTAIQRIRRVMPGDFATWPRTRHGYAEHPFARSFEIRDGHFSQIWPDGITGHGVVRAYAKRNGHNFGVLLSGIKNRIDLKWDESMEAVAYGCGDGLPFTQIHSHDRSITFTEAANTDLFVLGRFV